MDRLELAAYCGDDAAKRILERTQEPAVPATRPNFWPQLWQATRPFPWSKSKEEDARNFRAAIAAELIPWAIGFRDPVAERQAHS